MGVIGPEAIAVDQGERPISVEGEAGADRIPGPVRIVVLGPLAATVGGAAVPIAGRLQSRLVISLAAAAANGSGLTLTDLVDEVYGEDLPPKPRRALATLVWRLRRLLGTDAITCDGTTYRFAPGVCGIDAIEFEDLLRHGRGLIRGGDYSEAAVLLRNALALWDQLPAIESAGARPVAIRLAELRIGATEHLAHALARCGEHGAAIELLEDVVASNPEREHGHAQLIDSHLAVGDLTGARRVYDWAHRYLAEQGIEPGAALQEAAVRLTRTRSIPEPRQGEPAADPRPDVPGTTILTERRAELRRVVTTAAHAVRSRRPAAVLISGEPGIGKTTLAEASMRHLSAGARSARVVRLHCDPRHTLPYAPLSGLAALAGEFPGDHEPLAALLLGRSGDRESGPQPADAPLTDREHIHSAVLELIRSVCLPAGMVLLVEDLHWAPPDTVDALTALLANATDLPLVIIATTRDRTMLGDFAGICDVHVGLSGLGAASITELIGAEPDHDRDDHLLRLTGGNPLFVLQLQRAGALDPGESPAGLEAAITAHLNAMPPEIVDALGLAAVVGAQFEIDVLAALTGRLRSLRPVWVDRLTAAEKRGLIRQDRQAPGHYTFVHALVRDHLYRRLPAQRRTLAHAEIGRAMDRLTLARPRPADLLAHHYICGWPETSTREVIDKLRAAAEAAIAQLDFRQAADHHRRALDHLAMDPSAADPVEIAETLGKAARSAAAAGDITAATTLYMSQASLAERADIPSARISAALGLLRTHHNDHRGTPAADQLIAALATAGKQRVLDRFPDLAAEAIGAVQVHRPQRSDALLDELAADQPILAARLRSATWEHRDVAAQLTTARQLVADPAAEPVGAWLRLWVSEVAAGLRALDDPPECRVQVGSADDRTQFEVTLWRITTTIATGRLNRAGVLIDRALAAPRHPDAAETARRVANLNGQRLFLTLATGGADTVDQTSPLTVSPIWVTRHPIMRYLAAYLTARRGEQAAARDACDDLLDELTDRAFPDSALLIRMVLLADACLYAQHRTGMELCLNQLLPHSGHHAMFHFAQHWGAVDRAIGKLQLAIGDVDSGIASLIRALDQHRSAHAVVQQVQTHQNLSFALTQRGRSDDRTEAARHHEEASRIARGVGVRVPSATIWLPSDAVASIAGLATDQSTQAEREGQAAAG